MGSELIQKYTALKAELLEYFGKVASGLNLLSMDLAKAGQPFDAQNEHRYKLTLLREQALHLAGMAEEFLMVLDGAGLVVTTKARLDELKKQSEVVAEEARRLTEERDSVLRQHYHTSNPLSEEYDASDMLTWLLYHPEWQVRQRAEARNTVTRPEAYRAYMLKQLQAAMREG